MKTLKECGIWTIGTIQKNRLGGCKLMSDKQMKKNGQESYDSKTSKDGISIVKWFDSKSLSI